MIITAAAVQGPAIRSLISAATAVFECCSMVGGAVARFGSVSNAVFCILPCRFVLGVLALHVHRFRGMSEFSMGFILLSGYLGPTLSKLKLDPTNSVRMSELWSM
jgi:hypothetical protein